MKLEKLKYIHPAIPEIVRFEQGYISSLVIENQNLFRTLAEDFYRQSEGEDGAGVLSDDTEILCIAKYTEVVTQYVPFEINRKSLLTKLYSMLEKMALDAGHYLETQSLLGKIEKNIAELSFETDLELECPKLTFSAIIKACGVQFSENTGGLPEKILDYMEIVRKFEGDRLFVFFQLRSYFSDDEVKMFAETAINRDFKILLIDNVDTVRFDFEKRLIIDKDICLI